MKTNRVIKDKVPSVMSWGKGFFYIYKPRKDGAILGVETHRWVCWNRLMQSFTVSNYLGNTLFIGEEKACHEQARALAKQFL